MILAGMRGLQEGQGTVKMAAKAKEDLAGSTCRHSECKGSRGFGLGPQAPVPPAQWPLGEGWKPQGGGSARREAIDKWYPG